MEIFNIQDATAADGEVFMFSSQIIGESTSLYPRDASEDEVRTLRHVVGPVPTAVWLVAFAGAVQRFAYWGSVIPSLVYIQNLPDYPNDSGAFGLGDFTTSLILNLLVLFGHITPLLSAVLSDVWVGRYKTLVIGLIFFAMGCAMLLVVTTLSGRVDPTTGLAGLVVALILIYVGQGAVRIVIYPLIGDQLLDHKARTVQTRTGELVVTDQALTVQHIFNTYYWMLNVASVLATGTTFIEKRTGVWATYPLPACLLTGALISLIVWSGTIVKQPPRKDVFFNTVRVSVLAIRAGFRFSAAFPAHQKRHHDRSVPWSMEFVNDVQQAVRASRIVLSFAVFWLCYEQLAQNIFSQASQMQLGSMYKDTLQTFNPMACIVLIPLIQKGLFPWLGRRQISAGPVTRMTAASVVIVLGLGYSAFTQQLIYNQGPCFARPLICPAALVSQDSDQSTSVNTDRLPNNVSVWVQAPLHFILGVAEILGVVSLSEYMHVYVQTSTSLKTSLHSLQWLATAMGAAVGVALDHVPRDPWMVIRYGSLAGIMGCNTLLFWIMFRGSDGTRRVDEPQATQIV